jgi:hypothetical protein
MSPESLTAPSAGSVSSVSQVRALPQAALELLAVAESRHIEFGADWYANLVEQVFPNGTGIRFWLLMAGERCLAVLPTLASHEQPGELTALSNFYTAIWAPAIAENVSATELRPLADALRRETRAATLRFAPMDGEDRGFTLWREALRLAGYSTHRYFAFGNWYQRITTPWADYLQARAGQVRSTIKRMGKKFATEGGRLELIQGGERLEAGIEAYQAVYGKSWKVPEPFPGFVPGLIRLCARRGWLRLGVAWLQDKPVAAQLWIVANARADIFKLAYDEDYKHLAPGTLLTALLMEQAMDVDRVQEIDYLIGDDPYKATWMSDRRERVGLVAYDPRTLRGLLGMARQTLGDWRRAWRARRAAPQAGETTGPAAAPTEARMPVSPPEPPGH